MENVKTQQPDATAEINSRRFGYLMYGTGPATVAAGLLVIGIVAMMLAMN